MKKYKNWEIIVALMLPLVTFAMHWLGTNHEAGVVSKVLLLTYSAIVVWTYCRMYLGGKSTKRYPGLLMFLLIVTLVQRLASFTMSFYDFGGNQGASIPIAVDGVLGLVTFVALLLVTVRTYKERLTAIAVTLTCILVLPLVSLMLPLLVGRTGVPETMLTLNWVLAIVSSIAYAVLFLHRNDLFREPTQSLSA